VDALELLRLEAETIWGRDSGVLGSGTVFATATTYDGRTEVLAGHAEVRPETTAVISAARCWTLTPASRLPLAPPGFSLVHDRRSLLSGERGPWAALVQGGQVVSLAHCARLTGLAAEVGVRTEAAYQGRGLAAVVVRAWATLLASDEKVLFYSAFEDNHASHRVAARCGAEPLGMLCRLGISRYS
jgi:RimJ/RimL family protein N-acetyltransferase